MAGGKAKGGVGAQEGVRIIAENRKARAMYTVDEKLEAGLQLQGSEVKSLRDGKVQLRDSYARVERGEVWLYGVHVAPYANATGFGAHDPDRRRKLLLNQLRQFEHGEVRLVENGREHVFGRRHAGGARRHRRCPGGAHNARMGTDGGSVRCGGAGERALEPPAQLEEALRLGGRLERVRRGEAGQARGPLVDLRVDLVRRG